MSLFQMFSKIPLAESRWRWAAVTPTGRGEGPTTRAAEGGLEAKSPGALPPTVVQKGFPLEWWGAGGFADCVLCRFFLFPHTGSPDCHLVAVLVCTRVL